MRTVPSEFIEETVAEVFRASAGKAIEDAVRDAVRRDREKARMLARYVESRRPARLPPLDYRDARYLLTTDSQDVFRGRVRAREGISRRRTRCRTRTFLALLLFARPRSARELLTWSEGDLASLRLPRWGWSPVVAWLEWRRRLRLRRQPLFCTVRKPHLGLPLHPHDVRRQTIRHIRGKGFGRLTLTDIRRTRIGEEGISLARLLSNRRLRHGVPEILPLAE